jgi:hypothetical protein
MDVSGIVVRPLDPPLFVDLEVVWRRPTRPAVRHLVDFLLEAADGPDVLLSAPRRPSGTRAVRAPGPLPHSRPPL